MEVKDKNMSGSELELASLTADIVAAYVANNVISGDKLPEFIGSVYTALKSASVQGVEPPKVELIPAVPVKKSVTQDYIICLEDGKKFKSLKRHLNTHYGLTPEEYCKKWGLPRDYPMVAPAYAAARSDLAKNMGLGRRNGSGGTDNKPAPKEKVAKSAGKRARKAA
jgi:predicted transcriptional regulator